MKRKRLAIESAFIYVSINGMAILFHQFSPREQALLQFSCQASIGIIPIIIYKKQNRSFVHLGFHPKRLKCQLVETLNILFVLVIWFLLRLLIVLLFGGTVADFLGGKIEQFSGLVRQMFFSIFFLGLGEEILFRGYFFDRISFILSSAKAAVFMTAIMFGLLHFWVDGNVLQVVSAAVAGFIFAYARYKDYTILSVALAHSLYSCLLLFIRFILL